MSQIIIEVSGGIVANIYRRGDVPEELEVIVCDLDPLEMGEEVRPTKHLLDPWQFAPAEIMNALDPKTETEAA